MQGMPTSFHSWPMETVVQGENKKQEGRVDGSQKQPPHTET